MKLGGLFSGIGGFELAWTRLGHEVAWMCEIDPEARRVLEARFPGVPIYNDVRDLDPCKVEPVDVVTGGSPCQGFSIAGRREGLLHGESQLFADYVRIMDGLAEKGLRYGLWENVPGVTSIVNEDGERTWPHVVGALVGSDDPIRFDADENLGVGMAARGQRAVSWRILDSRHFGVAQRRRRLYACVAFGDSSDDRAGRALLAVGQGLPRDHVSFRETQKDDAAAAGRRTEAGVGFRLMAFGYYLDDDTASTLKQRDYKDATDLIVVKDVGVRRLTPTESERLQSFPDGWTEPAGSDSARYRALGNAVTVNTVQWILRRMLDAG